ncbi:hypothetical protein GOBAR_AA16321 [Gossypium barbadense]|uniref:Uncharacterized protein n=1 Tax=Gossypium barbadense TaxID=3634 RepID=A0A2P5XLY5_GOSBA|nr:hypothetical protein GOBAR_AA16321 [Gossypium barbadense]
MGRNRFESGGGYSGGRRGSLGHKSCAKRILSLVVAMVVGEQDIAIVENLSRWGFSSYVRCQHMKPLHELDERVVVTESVGPRAVGDIIRNVLVGLLFGRLGKKVLGRSSIVSSRYVSSIIPKNSSQGSVVSPVDAADAEDDAPFLFFEAGTTVFFPLEDDMVPAIRIIKPS